MAIWMGAGGWDRPQRLEQVSSREPGRRHHQPEGGEQAQGQPAAVVLAVDQQQGQGDQVGGEEAGYSAEAHPPLPESGGEWNVADRADETEHGDERTDGAFSTDETKPWPVKNRSCQAPADTGAARKPATRKPPAISLRSIRRVGERGARCRPPESPRAQPCPPA